MQLRHTPHSSCHTYEPLQTSRALPSLGDRPHALGLALAQPTGNSNTALTARLPSAPAQILGLITPTRPRFPLMAHAIRRGQCQIPGLEHLPSYSQLSITTTHDTESPARLHSKIGPLQQAQATLARDWRGGLIHRHLAPFMSLTNCD